MLNTLRPLDGSILHGLASGEKAAASLPPLALSDVAPVRLANATLDTSFLFRHTVRRELDDTMPVRTRDELYETPFRMTTPMALRVGILRSMHYSLDEIAAMMVVSYETVRKYSVRFYSEMAMTPSMAMRTTLAWAAFLLMGWSDGLQLGGAPFDETA